MAAYFAARLNIKNPEKFTEYATKAISLMANFGGKVLFKGEAEHGSDNEIELPGLAVFEFPNKAAIEEFFACSEYLALVPLREEGANMVVTVHEGS